ncbi:MAG: 23S rRNA (cytidine(2498)-2'-O)-methyltransferase RlmM [Pseudomonadota bacterium]|jgi:23S rRNA (cytidine2498-2'-O)-methyltransferase
MSANDTSPGRAFLFHCRTGFEAECAEEAIAAAARQGRSFFARTERGAALVEVAPADGAPAGAAPAASVLVFARQSLALLESFSALDAKDRLGPPIDALAKAGIRVIDCWVEAPDSEAGAELRGLARALEAAAIPALRKRTLVDPAAPWRAHLVLRGGNDLLLALADVRSAAPWPQGIPRLKFPREAPSRSTLKLDEAFLVLLDDADRRRLVRPGMTAVDLGASPGGWTFQLVARGMRVTAVDNGPMDDALMASGQVEHRREDGFRFRPRQRVDWVVCDMVEQPARVAALMRDWLAEGAARAAVFNLKLPMKKRWLETQRCIGMLEDALGDGWLLRAKQLYHDREEVTVAALPEH